MARFVSLVIGLVLVALGGWAVAAWWASVLVLLRGFVAVTAVLLGLGIVIFGLSEPWVEEGREKPTARPIMPPGPAEPA